MEPLLFLCHRLPYPPNKGDKLRSYHVLRHLAGRYRVFLGTFVDDPADWQHVEAVKALCADVHVEGIAPRARRIASASGFLTGDALTVRYYRNSRMHAWVRETARRERVGRAFAFSSPMAQYVVGLPGVRCIVDFVDMDSAKWGDYSRTRSWPASAVYARESRRALGYERRIARCADAVVFVTGDEARLFCTAAPESASRVTTIGNGVDAEYFSPARDVGSPYEPGVRAIVFTGAMDYWPNVDAVIWFAREILPAIRRHDPAVRFYVVGMNPDAAVLALADDATTIVTGRVADVRPFLSHARVVVAPLRVARGIQNKVLEAMAMAKATVVTPAAAAGLSARPGMELEVADAPQDFAARVLDLMTDPARAERMGALARARVLADYAWEASYASLDELLERGGAAAGAAVAGARGEVRDFHPGNAIAR